MYNGKFTLKITYYYLFFLIDGVVPDEIEEYLGSMIENEFDTYFEDGSLLEVMHCKLKSHF